VPATAGLDGPEQLRESRGLRRYLVLGIYVLPLPAGLLAERHGWLPVFASLALVELGALVLLARIAKTDRRSSRPSVSGFFRGLGSSLKDRRLAWAAGGAFAAQATVFAYVGGLPVSLAMRGYTIGAIGAISFAAVLAVLFVTRPRSGDVERFGRWAGVAPIAGLLVVAGTAWLSSSRDGGGLPWQSASALLYVAALGAASVLIELSKQWSQVVALLQARMGATADHDYRRQAVVGLGANLGALTGAGVGPWSAHAGQPAWLAALLGLAAVAWALQASWFAASARQ
jgi:hypothetical protein